jgi:hypothetical protein
MENQKKYRLHTVSSIFLLMLVGFATLVVLLLSYFELVHLDLELLLSPFVAVALLAFGEQLMILLFVKPIRFVFGAKKRTQYPGCSGVLVCPQAILGKPPKGKYERFLNRTFPRFKLNHPLNYLNISENE